MDALGLGPIFENQVLALIILGLAGIAAGIVNAMAGGGAFLTIPTLMALGLPVGMTIGTIRIAVLLQNLVVHMTFRSQGVKEHRPALRFIAPIALGALVGSALSTLMDEALLRPIFGVVFVAWAIILVARPGKFTEPAKEIRPAGPMAYLLAAGIGVYGGFIQAGVGFPMLAFLVMYLGYDAVRANAIKVILVGLYTVVALPVFIYAGKVAWLEASVLALGTIIGGWIGARWQMKSGAKVVRRFVLVMVAVSGIVMLASAL